MALCVLGPLLLLLRRVAVPSCTIGAMDQRTPFSKLHAALDQVLASGQKAVDVAALKTFIAAVERNAATDREVMKLEHESMLARYKADRDIDIEMLKSVLESAKTALNSTILINGGAAAALLALIGNLYGKLPGGAPVALPLVQSLVTFTAGVLLGGLATASTYFTQYCYSENHNRTGVVFHSIAVVLVLGSYGTFFGGIMLAYRAFAGA